MSSLSLLVAAQAFAGQVDAVGVVDEPIEDGIGIGRIADHVMPRRHGQLASDDGGAPAVAVLEDFEEGMAGLIVEGL